jgi:putative tryptophan/tyrosine transport system substrate-binding protein
MRRRAFLAFLGSAVWPLAARAEQQRALPRIGYLSLGTGPDPPNDGEFLAGLRDLGYVEGKTIEIEFRFTGGDPDAVGKAADDFVRENVDIIVAYATGVYAARRATSTIPIVMTAAGDAVAMGLAASLAHPGGNVTGLNFFLPELMAKRLELLKGRCHANLNLAAGKLEKLSSDSGRGSGSPRPERFFAEDPERASGCEMALDVECVVDGGVNGQEALG